MSKSPPLSVAFHRDSDSSQIRKTSVQRTALTKDSRVQSIKKEGRAARRSPIQSGNPSTDSRNRKQAQKLLRPFQNMSNKGQMKIFRHHYHDLRSQNRVHQRQKAEAEALRLMKNKGDMFERYLKKPA